MIALGRVLLALALVIAAALPGAAQGAAEAIGGTVRAPDPDGGTTPVAGVRIAVGVAGGAPVGEARTDERGRWSVDLPGPGRYTATIDRTTIPAGLALREGASAALTIEIVRNDRGIVVFPLAAAAAVPAVEDAGPGVPARLLQLAVDGLVFGLALGLAAVGLSLIFGVVRIVNFGHGDVISAGALVAVLLNAVDGGPQMHLVAAGIAAVLAAGLLGLVFEGLFRRIDARATDHFTVLVFSIGVSFVLRHALLFAFGPANLPYRQYLLQDLIRIGPVLIAPRDLAVAAISALLLVAVGLLLLRTRVGRAMRATATNRALAAQSGIDVRRIARLTWVIGTMLAAAGGVLLAIGQQARWDMGYQMLMFIFAAVILGGIGTAFGAMAGGLLIGLVAQLGTFVIPPELKPAVVMAVLVAVLLYRPLGLFNRARRIG
ncbi:MAG: branched-chain amino acid ABC transporter permease [Alphaproteobacteria bacterium]